MLKGILIYVAISIVVIAVALSSLDKTERSECEKWNDPIIIPRMGNVELQDWQIEQCLNYGIDLR